MGEGSKNDLGLFEIKERPFVIYTACPYDAMFPWLRDDGNVEIIEMPEALKKYERKE